MMAKGEEQPRDPQTRLAVTALSVLAGIVALLGIAGTLAIVRVLLATGTLAGPWPWQTRALLGVNLLMGILGIWGVIRLKPWRGWRGSGEPVSPATRAANRFYWLKELLVLAAFLAVIFGGGPANLVSNGPIAPAIAVVAIVCWLVARVLGEWWRHKADEHEQQSSVFGRNAAAAAFLAVTPAWWVAARAGLAPRPDAMILWMAAIMISTIGWSWRRYR